MLADGDRWIIVNLELPGDRPVEGVDPQAQQDTIAGAEDSHHGVLGFDTAFNLLQMLEPQAVGERGKN